MKKYVAFVVLGVLTSFCKKNIETTQVVEQDISESVYASGVVKSKNQYQAFASASGVISELLVKEGDTVQLGAPILKIYSRTQSLNKENAELTANYAAMRSNESKLKDAQMQVDLALQKMHLDSALYFRQKSLWAQQIGTLVDLEQKTMTYQNSKAAYFSANVKLDDLKRQLLLNAEQAQRQYQIAGGLEADYTLKSELQGIVFELLKEKGEIVSPQTPLAIIGEAGEFVLNMQVDEFDIFKIKTGMLVLIMMDSYKDQVFEAYITRVYPIMNERSKSFMVEAQFKNAPEKLYPNVTFEANIIIKKKENVLLIPRNYLRTDSTVVMADGSERLIKAGLMDLQMVEIVSGLAKGDEIQKPKK